MNGAKFEKELSASMLYKMMLIREFENTVSDYKMKCMVYGMAHCYMGQEAIAVGVCSALNETDYIISNHRPHGHAIAKGVDVRKMMAEIFGKATGTNAGKGGSMHINDKKKGLITSTGIVGSGIPVACGAAYSSRYQKDGKVTCVFFGDGAANEGTLHECLNLASIWHLPIIFVLEDNGLAVTTQTRDTSSCTDYVALATAYKIHAVHVDGQNVEMVYRVSADAVERARKESLPTLIQAKTIRFHEHAEGEWYLRMLKTGYRNYQELAYDSIEKCPIKLYSNYLLENNILSQEEIESLRHAASAAIQDSIDFALSSPDPSPEMAYMHVYEGEN